MSTMTLLADKVGRISLYFFDLVFDIIDKIIHRSRWVSTVFVKNF